MCLYVCLHVCVGGGGNSPLKGYPTGGGLRMCMFVHVQVHACMLSKYIGQLLYLVLSSNLDERSLM